MPSNNLKNHPEQNPSQEKTASLGLESLRFPQKQSNMCFSLGKAFQKAFNNSLEFKNLIKELNFKIAFGQHSGVIGNSDDLYELPRFPINEKYGNLDRFATLLKTIPFSYETVTPSEKYINNNTNPPNVTVKFSSNNKNLKSITCFSNEEDKWRKSKINFISNEKT